MSNVQTLLARCWELGAEFIPAPDGKLKVRAPAPLPEELQEELRRRKPEVLALLRQQAADYRSLYRQAAEAVADACFLVDPCWLLERHPELWQQMVALDDQLSRLEQQGALEQEYRGMLEQLCRVVQDARALY